MTEQKARKRQVRDRMAKTGERYTTASRQLTKSAHMPPRAAEPPFSEEAVRANTGKGWDEWFRILDTWKGTTHTHTEIARHLSTDLGVDGWWAQGVTVGYERARGMRAQYQRPDGFCAYASKTVPVEAERLFRAFADARSRSGWLERGTLKARTSSPPTSARFDFRGGPSRVNVYVTPKGPAKATAAIEHERLDGPDEVAEMKAFWKERLGALAARLSS
ncbi:MAG TPA: hypothetical protein VIC58_03240 [Actinomycetota bacterium]|jgi:hypothetical protein